MACQPYIAQFVKYWENYAKRWLYELMLTNISALERNDDINAPPGIRVKGTTETWVLQW